MLKFGAMGREIEVALFRDEKPVLNGQGPEVFAAELAEWAAQQDVKLRIKLVGRAEFRHWAYEYDRIRAEGRARLRELRKTLTAEDAPQLHGDGSSYLDEQAAIATDVLMRHVLESSVLELRGVEVDGLEQDAYRKPTRIVDTLEHAGLLAGAFAVVLQSQNPDRKDSFC